MINMGNLKKESKDIKKILSMSEIKGINVHNFISKNMRKKLEEKYGKTFFPMLGIAFDDKKKFVFLFHDSVDSIKKNKALILNQENFTNDEIQQFIEFVKANKEGE